MDLTSVRERPNSNTLRLKFRVVDGGGAQTRESLEWISSPSLAGAPKLCNSDNTSMRDPHCEVMLSGKTSHTRVESISFFVLDWICRVGMVI